MQKYTVTAPINTGEKLYKVGDTIELDDATAQQLSHCIHDPNAPAPVDADFTDPENTDGETAAKLTQKIGELNQVINTMADEAKKTATDLAGAEESIRKFGEEVARREAAERQMTELAERINVIVEATATVRGSLKGNAATTKTALADLIGIIEGNS